MPEKLLRCFTKTKAQLRGSNKKWTSKRIKQVARAICVKSTGQKFQHSDPSLDSMFNVSFSESGTVKKLEFNFSAPIEVLEASKVKQVRPDYEIRDPDSKIVVGQAILATVSTNHNRYPEKELKKAVKTLIGKTCQIDHSMSARDTFGIVTDAWWDAKAKPAEMAYIAELEGSDPVAAKVAKGYVTGVSVSGNADYIECSICGEEWSWSHEHWPGQEYDKKTCERIMHGITFNHLGFTPIPAFESADAYYVADSMGESIDNAMAYVDIIKRPPISTKSFGETMSTPEEKLTEALKEASKLQYQEAELKSKITALESKANDSDDLQKKLDKMRDKEKSRLFNDVIDLEVKLEKVEPNLVEARIEELAGS